MISRHYKSGENRNQSGLFPPSLDEYVGLNNTVRAIDAYVSTLDLNQLGFQHTEHYFGSGHPCYDPSDLLKLYFVPDRKSTNVNEVKKYQLGISASYLKIM